MSAIRRGDGSQIGQNCQRIVLKYCRYGGEGCQKFRKNADVVYRWSLNPKGGEKVTNPYRTMSFCLGCLSCSASSSSLFMTLVASELPEVPSDLSPVVDFDKRRGSWWPENRTEEKILHIRKSRVSHMHGGVGAENENFCLFFQY